MSTFESVHQDEILGSLKMFDRLIFKGHLLKFFPKGAFARFLKLQNVLLKEFREYVPQVSAKIKTHVQVLAEQAGRPYIYLESATTKASGRSKEDVAREIAQRDGVVEGLVCILGVLEPCRSFGVRYQSKTGKLEVIREARKCLYFYAYLIDTEFGWMHVRLQSWFPFEMQIYINGREWLSRQLDRHGISYQRYETRFCGSRIWHQRSVSATASSGGSCTVYWTILVAG